MASKPSARAQVEGNAPMSWKLSSKGNEPKRNLMNEIHRSPSLKEQYSQSSNCWQPDSEPIVRFWCDDGLCLGIPFFSVAGCVFDPSQQALSIVITGPKTEAFLSAFCKNRGTFLKADGEDILSVSFIPNRPPGDQANGDGNGDGAQSPDVKVTGRLSA
jgi:hypothetical protein